MIVKVKFYETKNRNYLYQNNTPLLKKRPSYYTTPIF